MRYTLTHNLKHTIIDLARETAARRAQADENARYVLANAVADPARTPPAGAGFSGELRQTFERFPLLTDGWQAKIDRALLDRLRSAPPLELHERGVFTDWTDATLPPKLLAARGFELMPLGRYVARDGSVLLLTIGTFDYATPRVPWPFAGTVRLFAQRVSLRRAPDGTTIAKEVGCDLLFDGLLGQEPELTVFHQDECILVTRRIKTLQATPALEANAFLMTTGQRLF